MVCSSPSLRLTAVAGTLADSNMVLAQNFFTRIALMENLLYTNFIHGKAALKFAILQD
jgi:hypothetical protein